MSHLQPGPELVDALRECARATKCAAHGCAADAAAAVPEWRIAVCLGHTLAFAPGVFRRAGDELVEVSQ